MCALVFSYNTLQSHSSNEKGRGEEPTGQYVTVHQCPPG